MDEAARRRLVKRLYIPLPDHAARKQLTANLMKKERNDLTDEHLEEVAKLTDGYSGADMMNLCQEASLGPIRSLSASLIAHIDPQQVINWGGGVNILVLFIKYSWLMVNLIFYAYNSIKLNIYKKKITMLIMIKFSNC